MASRSYRVQPIQAASLQRPRIQNILPVLSRSSSLSAIHRGLRGSERAQYGEARPRNVRERGRANKLQDDFKKTEKALDGAHGPRQRVKLMKKLQRKQDEIDGGGPTSRRKRFVQEDGEIGKSSIVWQLKHGSLKNLAEDIGLEQPVKPRSFRDRGREPRRDEGPPRRDAAVEDAFAAKMQGRREDKVSGGNSRRDVRARRSGFRDSAISRTGGRDGFRRSTRDEQSPRRDGVRGSFDSQTSGRRDDRFSSAQRSEAPARPSRSESYTPSKQQETDEPRQRPRGDFGNSDESRQRPRRDFGSSDEPHQRPRRDFENSNEINLAARERRGKMMPMTIQYTTAASQFLYGKSVVQSALEQARRKLYKLYIYGGENRMDSPDNDIIKALARKQRVPITIVPNEDQRLMDKMSMGRPHNGFVLETSPLPQLPVACLGTLEENAEGVGFRVRLDHQTKEEENVNGANNFVVRGSNLTPKPFVLLLNEILDPGNLGNIIRTASYLGVDAVGITNRTSANLTPVVQKSAAGAVEEVTIFTVDNAQKFIEESRQAGWKTYAAVAPPDKKLVERHSDKFISTDAIEQQGPLNHDPCLLVLGNEGFGLSKALKVAAEFEVSVPRFIQESCVDSLNVGVAAGLLCHSFVKQTVANEKVATREVPKVKIKEGEEAIF